MTFEVVFESPLCITSYGPKYNASSLSYRVSIYRGGRPYIEAVDYVYQLHPDNNYHQNKWLCDEAQRWAHPPTYIEPGIAPSGFPIPAKTAFVLAALNAARDVLEKNPRPTLCHFERAKPSASMCRG